MVDIKKFEGLQIETDIGFVDFEGIAKLPEQYLLKIIFEDDTFIEVTYHHEFVIDGFKIEACNLIEGEVLESQNKIFKVIKEIIEVEKPEEVYEVLEVKGIHRYFVNNILSHNCKFIGSTNTLIDSDVLERINTKEPIDTKWTGIFQVFEHPIKGVLYILGIDAAEGIGKDYSVIQVLKITKEHDVEQVAIFRCNTIEITKFAQICIEVSRFYNDAYMMIENNGVGDVLAKAIWNDHECDLILNCDKKGLGIKSTKRTKAAGNLLLKRYMESYWLKVYDKRTVQELSQYEEVKPGIYSAPQHAHDDCVTSLIWALYFVITEFFDGKSLEVKSVEDRFKIDNVWDNDKPIIFTDQDYDSMEFGEDNYDQFNEVYDNDDEEEEENQYRL